MREPLILSAGLGGSGNYWRPNLPALAERFRVILYDHRGTGRSDRNLPGSVSALDLARDIHLVMQALGIEQANVVGHAAGGVAGLALAAWLPDHLKRLVVVNCWGKADPHFLRCFEARLALLRNSGPESYLRAQPIFLYPADWISQHDAELNAELPDQIAHFPGLVTMEKRIAALAEFDIVDNLGGISAPTLVIGALDDMLVPSRAAEALARNLPIARLAMMKWGGHACNVTDPDTFNKLVLDFLGS